MKRTFYILLFVLFLKTTSGQTKFAGTFLLDNGMDSVNLLIKKDGSFTTTETSMCHGDDILGSKGKWKSNSDTIVLITDRRTRTGYKTKNYEYKPTNTYILKSDSLLFLDDKKQFNPKFSYRRVSKSK